MVALAYGMRIALPDVVLRDRSHRTDRMTRTCYHRRKGSYGLGTMDFSHTA
jgi:hypothetical protein